MVLVYLIEFTVVVVGITFLITQFLLPWLQGKPSLPLFRRSTRLEAEYRKVADDRDNAVREDEILQKRMDASLIRHQGRK